MREAKIIARSCLLFAIFAGLSLSSGTLSADPVRLTFVLACDVYEMKDEGGRGGLPKLAAVLKAEKARFSNVLVAHAGDAISPSLMSSFDQGAHMIDILNMMPIDVFVPGNHEFDFGPDVFRTRMEEAKVPVYAANLFNADGTPIGGIGSHRMYDMGGVKVGMIATAAEDSATKSQPGNLKFGDSVGTLVRRAAQLRHEGADLIVAVVHADRKLDEELIATDAADIILSGDDHDLQLRFNGQRVFAESMQDGLYVTAVDVDVEIEEKGGKRKISWWPNFRVIDTADVAPDPEVSQRVAYYLGLLSKEFDVVIGRTATELDSRNAQVRGGEAAIGNLYADAVREATDADVALINGGGFRANKLYPAGSDITRRDVLAELPFRNYAYLLRLTGADIKTALEQGFANAEIETGRFPQVSNLTIRADVTRPVGDRIVRVTIGDAPLDPSKTYTLATNDFLARRGDGYEALAKAEQLVGLTDAELIANVIMRHIEKAGVVAPKFEGRIIVARSRPPG